MKKIVYLLISFLIFALTPVAAADTSGDIQTAEPLTVKTDVNGKQVEFPAYLIGGEVHFKLRGLALAANSTEKQFEVTYDAAAKSIRIYTGEPYTFDGREMLPAGGESKLAVACAAPILIDGNDSDMPAYTIDDNNYVSVGSIDTEFIFSDFTGLTEIDDVVKLVTDFTAQLKNVQLTAPAEMAAAEIYEHYAQFTVSELVTSWTDNPETAPGRMVSSPWPEMIDVSDVIEISESEYTVNGTVIYITSTEVENGGPAIGQPVSLHIVKEQDEWKINDMTVGDDIVVEYKPER